MDLKPVFAMMRNGRWAEALERLEGLRGTAEAAGPGDRATYFQTLAGCLDRAGRTREALEAAEKALRLDRELWPEGRGTWLTLHSLVIILERLGRRDEAGQRAAELFAVGDKLGGLSLAGAASLRAVYLAPDERRAVLERGRFACQVAWRERNERTDVYELVMSWAGIAARLAATYLELGQPDRAEPTLLEVMPHVVASKAPAIAQKMALLWSLLASIARRAGRPEARYLFRCALANVTQPGDVDRTNAALDALGGRELPGDLPLDVMRAVRVGADGILLAHPTRGALFVPRDLAGELAPFDAVEVVVQGDRVRSIKRVK